MEQLARYSFTEVWHCGDDVIISHGGNMGHGIQNVRENVDHIFSVGVFDKLRIIGVEEGGADYMYSLTVDKADFDSIVLEMKDA